MPNIETTFGRGYRFGLEWSQSDVNSDEAIESNSSVLTLSAYIRSTGSSWTISSSGTKEVRIWIDGVKYSYTASGLSKLSGNQKKNLLTKSITIRHNEDGTRTVPISAWFNVAVTIGGSYIDTVVCPDSGSHNVVLNRIPRPSTSSVAGTVNVGSVVTINTNRAATDLTHTLQYSTDGGQQWAQIATEVGASYEWTVPEAIAVAYPNTTSGEVILRTITYLSGQTIGTRDTKISANITEAYSKPSVSSVELAQVNSASIPLYVVSRSTVTITATASLLHGAKAAYYTFRVNGQGTRVNSSEATAQHSFLIPEGMTGELQVEVTVTDTRGYTSAAVSKEQELTDYTPPEFTDIEIVRGNIVDGEFVPNNVGVHIQITVSGRITPLNNLNAKRRSAESKLGSAAYTEIIADGELPDYEFSALVLLPEATLDADKTYKVRVSISDSYATSAEIITVRSQGILMNFGADGRSAAIGGKATMPGFFQLFYKTIFQEGYEAVQMDSGQDLDELTQPGLYYSDFAGNLVNSPFSGGEAGLEVVMISETVVAQLMRTVEDKKLLGMARVHVSGAWTDWETAETGFAPLDHKHDLAGESVEGVLPVEHGGTGGGSVSAAREALGLGRSDGPLPVENGGTSSDNAKDALSALGIIYCPGGVPSSGNDGEIYLVPV